MKNVSLLRACVEEFQAEPVEIIPVEGEDELHAEVAQGAQELSTDTREDAQRVEDAERIAERLEHIGAAVMAEKEPSDLSADVVNIAVEKMCLVIGMESSAIPRLDPKNVSASVESFSETAKNIYEKVIAFLKSVMAKLGEFYQRVKELFAKLASRVEATARKHANFKQRMSSNAINAGEALLNEHQKEAGVFATEVMVEEVADLESKLTNTLGEAGINEMVLGIDSRPLAKFFFGPNNNPTSIKDIRRGVEQLDKIETAFITAVEKFVDESSNTYAKYKGQPNVGDLVAFGHYLQEGFSSNFDKGTVWNLEVEQNQDFSATVADEVKSLSFALQFPFYSNLNLNYNGDNGSLTVSSGVYYTEHGEYKGHMVQVCPTDLQAELLAVLTRDTSVMAAREQHMLDKLKNLGVKLADAIREESTAAKNAAAGGQEEMAKAYRERARQYKYCLHVMAGLQNLYSQFVTYRMICSNHLCDWISRSIDVLERSANEAVEGRTPPQKAQAADDAGKEAA